MVLMQKEFVHGDMESKRDKSQTCQFVEVEVVTVALKKGESASDDLME